MSESMHGCYIDTHVCNCHYHSKRNVLQTFSTLHRENNEFIIIKKHFYKYIDILD